MVQDILNFSDQLDEKVVNDVVNDRQPRNDDTTTTERLPNVVLEKGHTHLS